MDENFGEGSAVRQARFQHAWKVWDHNVVAGKRWGSDHKLFGRNYAERINPFLEGKTVVDAGCGKFEIGKHLTPARYIGIDIVPERIADCQAYAREDRTFIHGDLLRMTLPAGDVCLIRQVLQHCSNLDIATIVNRLLQCYPLVIATDEVRGKGNGDKRTERGIRKHGLFLELPPFNYVNVETLFIDGGLRTVLLTP